MKEPQTQHVVISKTVLFYSLICLLVLGPLIYILYVFGLPADKGGPFLAAVIRNYLLIMALGFFLATTIIYSFQLSIETKNILRTLFKITLILYAGFLFIYSLGRFTSFASPAIDVPYFHYALLQLSHFQLPIIWDSGVIQRPVWADHFSPILVFLVPLYWIHPHGITLMITQSLFVLSAAIPLYKATKWHLRSELLALALVTSYLTFGGIQWGYDYGFHEIMLLPPLFLWMYYFFIQKKYTRYFIFLLLSLFVKEEVSFMIIAWGLYLLFFKKDKKIGIITLFLGFTWYFLIFHFIFPFFTQGKGFGHWGQYSGNQTQSGALGIILNIVLHPFQFIHTLLNPTHKIDTIFHTFSPVTFLPFLYPPSLLILLPSLLEKLLSSNLAAKNGYHYSTAILIVTLISTIEALHTFLHSKFLSKWIPQPKLFFGVIITYAAFFSFLIYGYYPLSPFMLHAAKNHTLSDVELYSLKRTLEIIPKDASISAHAILIAHIDRPLGKLTHGPLPTDTADFIITNSKLPDSFIGGDPTQILSQLIIEGRYRVVINQDSVILLQRNR